MDENTDIHADDYGYSINTSLDIIECIEKKGLTSISLMVNMPDFSSCMELLYKKIETLDYLPYFSLHLNFVEGNFEDYFFPKTWGEIFMSSFLMNKSTIKRHYKNEIERQISLYLDVMKKISEIAKANNVPFSQMKLRIDSHVHTHVVPIVWESLIELIEEKGYEVEYIRNPKEPLYPFLKHINLYKSYPIINLAKNIILNIFSIKVDNYCKKHKLSTMYMWGLLMSGNMDKDRVKALFNDFSSFSFNDNRKLEILFHPGYAHKEEYKEAMNKNNFSNFNNSLNRNVEKEALLCLTKGENNEKE